MFLAVHFFHCHSPLYLFLRPLFGGLDYAAFSQLSYLQLNLFDFLLVRCLLLDTDFTKNLVFVKVGSYIFLVILDLNTHLKFNERNIFSQR